MTRNAKPLRFEIEITPEAAKMLRRIAEAQWRSWAPAAGDLPAPPSLIDTLNYVATDGLAACERQILKTREWDEGNVLTEVEPDADVIPLPPRSRS